MIDYITNNYSLFYIDVVYINSNSYVLFFESNNFCKGSRDIIKINIKNETI